MDCCEGRKGCCVVVGGPSIFNVDPFPACLIRYHPPARLRWFTFYRIATWELQDSRWRNAGARNMYHPVGGDGRWQETT